MSKAFSVITINYNNLPGLKRTLDSVWSQTARENIELIVIDGGSSDGSQEFLESHKAKIDTLVSEKDSGIYDAMNKGQKLATADYCWFVNSGDAIYEANTAEKLLSFAGKRIPILYGDTMFIDQQGKELGLISKLKPQGFPKHLDSRSFRYGMNICHQSFLALRELCPPFNLEYRQAADIDWILNILQKNPENACMDFILARFETGGSSYQNEKKAWKERYEVLRAHYGFLSNLWAHAMIVGRRIVFKLGLRP